MPFCVAADSFVVFTPFGETEVFVAAFDDVADPFDLATVADGATAEFVEVCAPDAVL